MLRLMRLPDDSLQPTAIVRGRKISADLKYTILALGALHSVSEIAALTAVSRREIYRIRKHWETTGTMGPERKKRGWPRFLTRDEELVILPSICSAAAINES